MKYPAFSSRQSGHHSPGSHASRLATPATGESSGRFRHHHYLQLTSGGPVSPTRVCQYTGLSCVSPLPRRCTLHTAFILEIKIGRKHVRDVGDQLISAAGVNIFRFLDLDDLGSAVLTPFEIFTSPNIQLRHRIKRIFMPQE